jgi:hypothetical protein
MPGGLHSACRGTGPRDGRWVRGSGGSRIVVRLPDVPHPCCHSSSLRSARAGARPTHPNRSAGSRIDRPDLARGYIPLTPDSDALGDHVVAVLQHELFFRSLGGPRSPRGPDYERDLGTRPRHRERPCSAACGRQGLLVDQLTRRGRPYSRTAHSCQQVLERATGSQLATSRVF